MIVPDPFQLADAALETMRRNGIILTSEMHRRLRNELSAVFDEAMGGRP